MAGSISDYLENELLDHVLGTGAFAVPTDIYLSLHTTPCTDAAPGTEVATGSYARTVMNAWDAGASRATENTNAITFPQATASWGTVTHVGIYDAVTGGNYLGWSDLTVSRAIGNGDTAEFAAGDIDVSFSAGGFTTVLADKLLDHIFKTTPYTAEDTYLALFTVTPGDAGGGTEVTGGSYAREEITAWDVAASGASENTNPVTFTQATGSWGTVVAFAIMSAVTAGNMNIWAAVDASKSVSSGETASWAAGALDITLS